MQEEKYNPGKIEKKGKKFYALVEFPYPSGEGLHIGHPRSYVAIDIIARKKRMEGFDVLYPIGWDAFGLPTENYAIKVGRPPQEITKENTDTFRRQLKSLGISFDWDREINTTDPKYYRWTQWIFLQLFKRGLAYKDNIAINWCPKCKIGLANEEVIQGNCERCGAPTEKREKEQWMLAITKYADRLLADLEGVDYLKKIKIQQRNWIGRKEWIDIKYPIKNSDQFIEVSTTRPDTNFGATFIVVAPEHSICASSLISSERKIKIEEYAKLAFAKTEEERIAEGRKKTGVFTGLYATNQLNHSEMPIWVADFILPTVGTGAVVGVPGHDRRDFEFAQEFNLPIIRVVIGEDGDRSEIAKIEQVQEEEGTMINSDFLDGLDIHKATQKNMNYLEEKGWGKRTIRYHLRDWVFSRQHYWGEPIPIIYCRKCWESQKSTLDLARVKKIKSQKYGRDYIKIQDKEYAIVPIPEDQLPIKLPIVEKYQPTDSGESPLSAITDWVNTKCPVCGSAAIRETDTMPNWAGSSWYYLRYIDPNNDRALADPGKLRYWLPVDLYNGGMEHVTLHLLYSRFWHKFLFDIGVVPTKEPYQKRVSHGLILAEDGQKMSKSRGNVINPDEIVKQYGADAFRLYEMFLGPFDQVVKWQTDGIRGTKRFLERIDKVFAKIISIKNQLKDISGQSTNIHKLIKQISDDIENMRFNTAVSNLMIWFNGRDWGPKIEDIKPGAPVDFKAIETFLTLLSTFAPYIAEELWEKMGHKTSIFEEKWPEYDPNLLKKDQLTIVIQINGKVRGSIEVDAKTTENEIKNKAQAEEKIQKWLIGKKIKKTIYVPGKLVNFVTSK